MAVNTPPNASLTVGGRNNRAGIHAKAPIRTSVRTSLSGSSQSKKKRLNPIFLTNDFVEENGQYFGFDLDRYKKGMQEFFVD